MPTPDTITTFVTAWAAQLTVAGGLTGYAFWPEDFGAVVPAIAIVPKNIDYDVDSGDNSGASRLMEWSLVFFAARVSDGMAAGLATLYAYLDDRTAGSIYALIAADPTISDTCGFCRLISFGEIRMDFIMEAGGMQFVGCVGKMEVLL